MQNHLAKAFMLVALALPFGASVANAATPDFNVTGDYVVSFDGYLHDMDLTQSSTGTVTGTGGYPAGSSTKTYTWHVTSGVVSDDDINLTIVYDSGATGTIMHMDGDIATSGVMSGTWDDNFGGFRTGSWYTSSGTAALIGSLVAEDFGVVDYNTGNGVLKGYTAGFALTNTTFAEAESVVVKLYSGATLLQINTATAKFFTDINGTQMSSPFDVLGSFDYEDDGYWDNDRAAEYGDDLAATRVVATVTLENGKVVTASNTTVTGDTDILTGNDDDDNGTTTPNTRKDECKKGGWLSFLNPSYKNQGQCVSQMNHMDSDENEDDEDDARSAKADKVSKWLKSSMKNLKNKLSR